VLQYRKEGPERIRLSEALAPTGTQITFVQTDLNDPAGRSALAAAAAKIDDLGLIVHAASPAVTAPLDELVAVNFEALKDMVDAALPTMLGRQSAAFVLVGSTAIEHSRPGWEAYAGAKGMAATFINGIEQAYASYGVRGLHLLTGLVATRFSAAFRGTTPALLPQEVAEALLTLIEDRGSPGNTLRLDLSGGVRGRFGFYTDSYRAPRVESAAEIAPTEVVTGRITSPADALLNGSSPVAAVVLKMLHLPANAELGDARLGVTPGWDSLKHIELLVTLESALGIRFASGEMESLHSFSQLDSLCRKKIAEKGSR
jgi:NAD(P)-dependent dehydrogenase (short-subunit alcohol dehydrogenase family)